MEESGVKSYTLRRSKETKEFIEEMNEVFENAKNNAPSVILLDDMDKYAPEEKNSEEFAVLQALIDSVKKKS
jgi:cell division protease FtsH